MDAQLALQNAMIQQFQDFKTKNVAYSLRAYARKLKINSGVLSSILSGRRRVSTNMAERLLERMAIDPAQASEIVSKFRVDSVAKSKVLESKKIMQLKSDQFQLISDGIHFALLCLMETANFKSDIDWMSIRLQENPQKIQASLQRLLRLGLIKTNAKRKYILTGVQLTTSDGIQDSAIQRYHQERLIEAQTKIDTIDIHDRDLYSTTYSVNRSQIPKARKLIREFAQKMQDLLEVDDKDEVYRFNMQLVPLTDVTGSKETK